jgi:hypothetical protein
MLGQRYEDYRTNFMPDTNFPKVLIFSVLPREIQRKLAEMLENVIAIVNVCCVLQEVLPKQH